MLFLSDISHMREEGGGGGRERESVRCLCCFGLI